MRRVFVTVYHSTLPSADFALPADVPTAQIAEQLAELLHSHPSADEAECRLEHRASARMLRADETLRDAGIWSGSILHLHVSPKQQLAQPTQLTQLTQPTAHSQLILKITQATLTDAAWFPDGRALLLAQSDNQLIAIDPTTGARVAALPHPAAPTSVAWHPAGRLIATGGWDGVIRLWDVTASIRITLTQSVQAHAAAVRCLAFSPDGALLASGSLDGAARLWSTGTGTQMRQLPAHAALVRRIAFSGDGRFVGTAGWDGVVRVVLAHTGEVVLSHAANVVEHANGLAFFQSSDNEIWLAASSGLQTKVWRMRDQQLVHTLRHESAVQVLAVRPNSGTLAAGCEDGTLQLWQAESGQLLNAFQEHTSPITHAAFKPDGKALTTLDEEGCIRIWTL